MPTDFAFSYRGGTFLARSAFHPPAVPPAPSAGRPCWHLTRGGAYILTLPFRPHETQAAVQERLEIWLGDNFGETVLMGHRYQFYLLAADFMIPEKDLVPADRHWMVQDEGTHITVFPHRLAPSLATAVETLKTWLAWQARECFGGPWDGRRVRDFGPRCQLPLLEPPPLLLAGTLPSDVGCYILTPRGYEWHPEASADEA